MTLRGHAPLPPQKSRWEADARTRMTQQQSERQRFQFGLRTLLVLVLAGGAGLGSLQGTQVSDAGLGYLEAIDSLKFLDLAGTNVTPEGVKKLQEVLPECEIAY